MNQAKKYLIILIFVFGGFVFLLKEMKYMYSEASAIQSEMRIGMANLVAEQRKYFKDNGRFDIYLDPRKFFKNTKIKICPSEFESSKLYGQKCFINNNEFLYIFQFSPSAGHFEVWSVDSKNNAKRLRRMEDN